MKRLSNPSLALFALLLALGACSKQEPAAPAAAPTPAPAVETASAAAPAAPVAAVDDKGKAVYAKTCSLCHASGVAGAPKPGDKADWGPRIAQGMDVLHQHAINGFNGNKGAMPARGGGASLSDDEVKAAVDHMVSLSR